MADSKSRRHFHVNSSTLPWQESKSGDDHELRYKSLSAAVASKELGCTLIELPPGMHSFPYHAHLGNEEAIYVLSGAGRLRLGEESQSVGAGDYIALPSGPEFGRQMRNDSDGYLRYLCFSTMKQPDVVLYGDSKKIAVLGGMAPGGEEKNCTYFAMLDAEATKEYWDGEGENSKK